MNEDQPTSQQYTVPPDNAIENNPPVANPKKQEKQEVLIRFFLGIALMLGICYAGIYFKKPWLLILGLLIAVPFAGMLIFFSALTDSK
jgi:hypothetical protein